jgi:hypothetical protein
VPAVPGSSDASEIPTTIATTASGVMNPAVFLSRRSSSEKPNTKRGTVPLRTTW